MPDIIVRQAQASEWPIIQKLNAEVFENDRQNDDHLNPSYPYSKQGIAYYQSACTNPTYHTIIAFDDNTPIGYIIASPKKLSYRTNQPLEIENIGVTKTRRSQGVGSFLIEHLKTWAKQNGYTHLFVNAYCRNERVHRFYQKHGLTPIDLSFEGKL